MTLLECVYDWFIPGFTTICITIIILDYYRRRQRARIAFPPGFNVNKQAVRYGGDPYIFGSPLNQGGKLLERANSAVSTLYEVFLRGLEASHNGDCLGHRPGENEPYVWKSYSNVFRAARDFGAGLVSFGLKPSKSSVSFVFKIVYSQLCKGTTLLEKATCSIHDIA